jgi:hypothetical protein
LLKQFGLHIDSQVLVFSKTSFQATKIGRRDTCLQCHQGLSTLGIPGILVSSVYPGADGMPAFRGNAMITDHRTALDQRWGGWYVTGTHGSQNHMGNAVGHDTSHPQLLEIRESSAIPRLTYRLIGLPSSGYVRLQTGLRGPTRLTRRRT